MKFAEEIAGMLGALAVLMLLLGNSGGAVKILTSFSENYNAGVSGLQPGGGK